MTRRIVPCLLAVAGLALGARPARAQAPAPAPAPAPARVPTASAAELQWLAGCWEGQRGALVMEEQWQVPRAGVLLGLGRTTRGDSLVGYEFMRIHARGATLVLAAQPSGQVPAEFVARTVSAREVVFENPAHDFPQRISYRAVGVDSLHARIEGMRNGQLRGIDFPYARTACASGDSGVR